MLGCWFLVKKLSLFAAAQLGGWGAGELGSWGAGELGRGYACEGQPNSVGPLDRLPSKMLESMQSSVRVDSFADSRAPARTQTVEEGNGAWRPRLFEQCAVFGQSCCSIRIRCGHQGTM